MTTRVLIALAKKLGGLLFTLFLSSLAIFSALALTPGDPVTALLGGSKPTAAKIAELRAAYHLNDPWWQQYLRWVGNLLQGDLGRSYVYKAQVVDLIGPRLQITVTMVLLAAVLIIIFGIGSGIVAGLKPRTDKPILLATSLGMAMPTFVVAILLIGVFAKLLGWFPVQGAGDGSLPDRLYHLILPSVALAAMFIAYLSRVTRAAIVGQAGSEHVDTARVRGIPASKIFRRHILLNASPQILSLTGLTVAGLFAASAVAEQAFGIAGFGALLTEAAARKDIPLVQTLSMMLVTVFVVLNAVTDAIVAFIDPDSLRSVRSA